MPSLRSLVLQLGSSASLLGASFASPTTRPGGAEYCATFGNELKLDNTQVLFTTYHAGNETFNIPGAHQTCTARTTATAALCRIALLVNTTASSQTQMEIWLPDQWAGRVASVGNGGLAGCIDYSNLNYLASLDFAVVGSNNGHNGTGGAPFLNAPEVITDFAWRSIHTEAVLSKQIVKEYYSKPAKKSYYVGCSTGGRQGFRSVQDFPEDFDGVLAGAPAFDFNHLIVWSAMNSIYNGAPSGRPVFSTAEGVMVTADVVAQCDLLDGVADGIVDDPDLCDYDPEGLRCTGANTTGCLNDAKIEAIKKIFSPIRNRQGDVIYPRFDPSAPFDTAGRMIFGGSFFQYSLEWYRYVVYNDSTWQATNFGFDDIEKLDAQNPAGISTFKTDLSAFNNRGGKVITYHGRNDPLIASGNSVRYRNLLEETMGAEKMEKFYRFFSIAGMDHCSGGPGANAFGQGGGSAASGVQRDSQHNAVLALVDWVENGKAPEQIIATKFVGDSVAAGVESQRTFCAWPKKSVLQEGGDWKRADAWSCV